MEIQAGRITESQREEAQRALESLSPLMGSWEGRGMVHDPEGRATAVSTSDSFEWLEGAYFLVHRWHWKFGRHHFQGIELLGYEPQSRRLFSRMFDNAGHHLAYELHWERSSLHYEGAQQRARLELSPGHDSFTNVWEHRLSTGEWRPLSEIRHSRSRARRPIGFS